MSGFVESCKVATCDYVAAARAPQASPLDIFAVHIYTRAELAPVINAAYLDGDEAEIDKWRKVEARTPPPPPLPLPPFCALFRLPSPCTIPLPILPTSRVARWHGTSLLRLAT